MVKQGLGKKDKKGDTMTRFWYTFKEFAPHVNAIVRTRPLQTSWVMPFIINYMELDISPTQKNLALTSYALLRNRVTTNITTTFTLSTMNSFLGYFHVVEAV
jgi:hypothetical protein